MGYSKITGGTDYEMTLFLTPLGVEKFYAGNTDSVQNFTISDAEVNYLAFNDTKGVPAVYVYDRDTGGEYEESNGDPYVPKVGYVLNLRGSVDRDLIIADRALPINNSSLYNYIVKNETGDTLLEQMFTAYKLSTVNYYDKYDKQAIGSDKYFDKPIVLGGRNMWRTYIPYITGSTADANNYEGFLCYQPPKVAYQDYISDIEPTIGTVSTGATDYVPFPGVSVTDNRRSWTEIQYCYFLNKTKDILYVNSFILKNIFPVTHTVYETIIDKEYSREFVKVTYVLQWDAKNNGVQIQDSAINIFIPQAIYNREKIGFYPYEVVIFGVSFEIISAGSVVEHWHGQTFGNPSVKEGQYSFTIVLAGQSSSNVALTDLPLTIIGNGQNDPKLKYGAEMDIIVKVKDSGYKPNTYKSAQQTQKSEK
jgi:hypothetical protein